MKPRMDTDKHGYKRSAGFNPLQRSLRKHVRSAAEAQAARRTEVRVPMIVAGVPGFIRVHPCPTVVKKPLSA